MNLRVIHRPGLLAAAACLVMGATKAGAQEFVPPDRRPAAPPPSAPPDTPVPPPPQPGGVRVDVFGFSTRLGGQVNADGQVVLGSTVDLVQLGSPRLRIRPSFEVGFGRPETSLGANLEVLYRFQSDAAPAIPYVGVGWGYYDDGAVEHGWPTVALGFELPFKRSFNWLVEYHGLDGLRRSRFLLGLATRAGG